MDLSRTFGMVFFVSNFEGYDDVLPAPPKKEEEKKEKEDNDKKVLAITNNEGQIKEVLDKDQLNLNNTTKTTAIAKKKEKYTGAIPPPSTNRVRGNKFIIQKYLEEAMVIHGRKFDIRVWALVTHDFKLYIFKEGYLRLSGEILT